MIRLLKILCLGATIILSSSAFAAGKLGPWTVTSVAARDVGYDVSFAESTGWCGGGPFYIDPNNPRAKEIYSMLLAAVLSGKKVSVWVSDNCQTTQQIIAAAWISP